jgi:hypothetical protein
MIATTTNPIKIAGLKRALEAKYFESDVDFDVDEEESEA